MTTHFKNLGYGLGHFSLEELAPLLDEFESIDQTNELVYELTNSTGHLEHIVTPLIAQYNSAFDYPNSVEVLQDTRPLRLVKAWAEIGITYRSRGNSLMRAIIFLGQGHCEVDYTDSLGFIRTMTIPVEFGTTVVIPSKLRHRVITAIPRVYADFVFNLQPKIAGTDYILP